MGLGELSQTKQSKAKPCEPMQKSLANAFYIICYQVVGAVSSHIYDISLPLSLCLCLHSAFCVEASRVHV